MVETPLVRGVQANGSVIAASGYMARLVAEEKLGFEVERWRAPVSGCDYWSSMGLLVALMRDPCNGGCKSWLGHLSVAGVVTGSLRPNFLLLGVGLTMPTLSHWDWAFKDVLKELQARFLAQITGGFGRWFIPTERLQRKLLIAVSFWPCDRLRRTMLSDVLIIESLKCR